MRPKLGLLICLLGTPRFVTLKRFEICASYSRPILSLILKRLPIDVETVFVPGPYMRPTPQFPNRPMLFPGTENAAGFSHWAREGFAASLSTPPTQSGRM